MGRVFEVEYFQNIYILKLGFNELSKFPFIFFYDFSVQKERIVSINMSVKICFVLI